MKCIFALTSVLFVSLAQNLNAQYHSIIKNSDRYWHEALISDSTKSRAFYENIIYAKGDYFKWTNPRTTTSFNSTYSRTFNDAAVWKGKGLTQDVSFGFQFKKGALNITFEPITYFSQNSPYSLASIDSLRNEFNYQFGVSRRIDYVQRYGSTPFLTAHPGQSEIALRWDVFQFALSTQNFIIGPARDNSILMSNSAAGFPHLMIGTPRKINFEFFGIDFGRGEFNVFMGLLDESDYFDQDPDNDLRYINGMSASYEHSALPGLSVGFNRVMYKNEENFYWSDLYSNFYIRERGVIYDDKGDTLMRTGNDTFDQMAAAYIEWHSIQNDLRLFFEFARNDFNGSMRRFITEFEHSRAYSLGLEKAFVLKSGKSLRLSYEHTFLPRYMSYQYRPNPSFYTHSVALHGYTHDGQLLGAGTGPGSVSDLLKINWLEEKKLTVLTLQRIRFDEDYFIVKVPNNLDKINRHDVEFTTGLKHVRKLKNINLGSSLDLSYRFNQYFEKNNDKVNLGGSVFVEFLID